MIKNLCFISVICGTAEYICPDGILKTMMKIVCSAAVIVTLLSGITAAQPQEYAVDMAKYHALEDEILQNAESKRNELDRTVIASQCEAYIKDKAVQYGAVISEIGITLAWSREGVWVPCSLCGCAENEDSRKIAADLAWTELGIPYENQEWRVYGSGE